MKLSEQVMFWPGPITKRRELSDKIAQLEAELEDERNLRYETQNKTSKRIYELEAENERLREAKVRCPHCVRLLLLTDEGRRMMAEQDALKETP